MKIAIIIPVYNERKNIKSVIERINFTKKDIIVVDDGSTDGTYEEIKNIGATILRHNKNMGKGMAQRTGFNYAINNGYDYVITLDGDGQHNPDEISKFIKKAKNSNADIIVGTREYNIFNMPTIRYFVNIITSFIVSFLSHNIIKDSQSGYRMISTNVLKNIKLLTKNFQTESELLIKAGKLGYKIDKVNIATIYNESRSKIRPVIDTIRFIVLAFRCIYL